MLHVPTHLSRGENAGHFDAPLTEAAAELNRLDADITRVLAGGRGKDLDDIPEARTLNDRRTEVLITLREVQASTIIGVEAKARALRTPDLINDYEQHGAIAASLAEDIARLAEARVSAEREPVSAVLATEGTRLFKLACREFDDQVAALHDRGVDRADLEKATRQLRRDLRLDALFELTGDDAPNGARGNLATWPSAPAPLVADEADPVLAAIAASRAALDAFIAACGAPDADTQAGQARTSAAGDLSQATWRQLLAVPPLTVGGVQALASYVTYHIESFGCWDVEEDADARRLFHTIGTALACTGNAAACAAPVRDEEGLAPTDVDRALGEALARMQTADQEWREAIDAAEAATAGMSIAAGNAYRCAPGSAEANARNAADRAWRDLFRIRPANFEGLFRLLYDVVERRERYEGISNAPDILGSLLASIYALRTSTVLAAPAYDLGQLSVADLETLAEVCHLQAEGLNTAGYLPLCSANGLCTPLGEIFDREWNRMGILRDLAVTEIAARRPADDEERDDRLRTLLRQDLLADGRISPALLAEAAAAWGQR